MDSEYAILSVLLIALGVTGIALFTGPKTGDSCLCMIPSPEAGAMQGTASILLIFGVMFVPIAILKGGPPSFRRAGPRPTVVAPHAGKVFIPIPIASGKLYAIGTLLLFVGIDLVAIPAFFILESSLALIAGVLLSVLGGFLIYQGTRLKSKEVEQTSSV